MRGRRPSRQKTAVSSAVTRLRQFLGETQTQFGKRFAVTKVTVARWETSHPPTRDTLQRILRVADENVFPGAAVLRIAAHTDEAADREFGRLVSIAQKGNIFEAGELLKTAWLQALAISDQEPHKPVLLDSLLQVADRLTIFGRMPFEDMKRTFELVNAIKATEHEMKKGRDKK
jgi:transcriptional regulator with XRE-family HTH domain